MIEQIKASAGSGKTYTLTRRFLQELSRFGLDFDAPAAPAPCHNIQRGPGAFSEILAMTFTNKAASEMKARVLSALKTIALRQPKYPGDDEPDKDTGIRPSQARSWLDFILRRYDSLNIRTIDSLLNLLLQISSMSLDIPPDFELAFDEREFLDPLYDEVLDKAAQGDEELNTLLRECAAYLLNTSKSAGLTPRGKIRAMLLEVLGRLHGLGPDELPCVDKERIVAGREACLHGLANAAVALEESLDRLELAPSKLFTKFMDKLWNYIDAVPGQKFPTSNLVGRESFQDCCNKAEKALVDEKLESDYHAFCSTVNAAQSKLSLYDSALQLLPFARLARLLLPEIARLQEESGKISASLLSALAARVLDTNDGVSEACCRLGSRLNHILIDEFQDTSREQWQAILPLAEECLAHGGSLRYVGDVKQAIYSWRGGDSSLFEEIIAPGSSLHSMEPEPRRTPLEYNWRSAQTVVRHNNDFFSRLADPETAYLVIKALLHKDYPDDYASLAAADLARAFAGSSQGTPENAKIKVCGLVRMQRVGGEALAEYHEDVRQKLQALFADLRGRRKNGDIAILVRNGAEARLLADWLAEWDITVVTEHSFKVAGNPLVRRIIALLRWLDYPPDDLNFFNFISGSEVFGRSSGLDAGPMINWEAEIRKRHKGGLPLFRHFQEEFPSEWRLWLEPFYRRSGLMSAYDIVSEIYNRYSLLAGAPGHAVYLRRFLELVLAAEKEGASSISGFLEFWDDKGREEKIPAPENPDAVRLMTMHKAKGLEFKVLIVPFHRFSGRARPEAVVCQVDELPLLVKEGPALGEPYYLNKNNAAIEMMNLLYVAWTRAGEELHLFIGGSENDRQKAGLPKALDFLLQDYNFSEDGIYVSGQAPEPVKNQEEAPEPAGPLFCSVPTPEDEDWQPMGWLPKLKIFRNLIPDLVYDERIRGILFHNCLENFYLPQNSPENLKSVITRIVDYTMRGFHLPVIHAAEAKRELEEALAWFCSLPQARYWLAQGRAEQTIMDEEGRNHRVDMLVEEEDGSLLVLEYKSGQPRAEYAEQVSRYLLLLGRSTGKRVRGLLVYLDGKKLEEVRI